MTAPRRILPGNTYMVTRRTTQRLFLLRPDDDLLAIFAYCLGEAAARYDMQLIAWCVMSNHYHAIVHDPHGRLPAFIEHLHKMLSKAINALRGRWEGVWSSEETCITLLATLEDVLDKVVYVLANPMAAHLVDQASHWPGLHSLYHLDGRVTEHKRPQWFFKKNGKVMPPSVSLRAVPPPGADESWATQIRAAVEKKEREYRAIREEKGIRILGRKGVLATDPFSSPAKETTHRKLRPALACKDDARRVAELASLKGFRVEYARKLTEYIEAKTPEERQSVVFPAGTYRLRRFGVRCEPFALASAA
jgi:putative transposase